jgi:hypothetical protein
MSKTLKLLFLFVVIINLSLPAHNKDHIFLKRRQGKEILDCENVPSLIREPIYTSLGLAHKIAGLFDLLETVILDEVLRLKTTHLIELGSGSGLNLKILAEESKRRGFKKDNLEFLLTDKFPNVHLWRSYAESTNNLSIYEKPLEFSDILVFSNQSKITFLIIAASHHMDDGSLQKFLHDSAKLKANIIIVEPLARKLKHAGLAIVGSASGLATPFMRNLSLKDRGAQATIYYSGIGLFIQSFDGVASTFRQRTKEDFIILGIGLPYVINEQRNLGHFANYSMVSFEFPRENF